MHAAYERGEPYHSAEEGACALLLRPVLAFEQVYQQACDEKRLLMHMLWMYGLFWDAHLGNEVQMRKLRCLSGLAATNRTSRQRTPPIRGRSEHPDG